MNFKMACSSKNILQLIMCGHLSNLYHPKAWIMYKWIAAESEL